MNNIDKHKIKLEKEKKLLMEELSSLGRVDKTGDWVATPEKPVSPQSERGDRAELTEDFEERSSILDTLEIRLADINKALVKIDNNEYGICESCKKSVEQKRLEANPAAGTCESCMEK